MRKTAIHEGSLTVLERVRAAILHLTELNGYGNLTVSEVCRAARVNRSNLYDRHRNVVEEILAVSRGVRGDTRGRAGSAEAESARNLRLKNIEKKYKALMLVCLEQQAENTALRLQISSLTNQRELEVNRSSSRVRK